MEHCEAAVKPPARRKATAKANIWGRAFQWLAYLLVVAVILICVGIVIAPRFGWNLNVVYGGSMEPSMGKGSLAVIRPVDPLEVTVGDVITYKSRSSDMLVTHRVVEVKDKASGSSPSFITRGDANEGNDPLSVPSKNIVGGVWLSVPYLGYVMDYLKEPLVFGLAVGIPALFIVALELKNIYLTSRALRRRRRRRVVSR